MNSQIRGQRWRFNALHHDAQSVTLNRRIDHTRQPSNLRLKIARASGDFLQKEGVALHGPDELRRVSLRKNLPFVQKDDMIASLGLIHIRRAQQDGYLLTDDLLPNDAPQFAA